MIEFKKLAEQMLAEQILNDRVIQHLTSAKENILLESMPYVTAVFYESGNKLNCSYNQLLESIDNSIYLRIKQLIKNHEEHFKCSIDTACLGFINTDHFAKMKDS